MKLSIESTDQFAILNGLPCRIRAGTTPGGHAVEVYIHLIGTDDPAAQFEINCELGGHGPVEVEVRYDDSTPGRPSADTPG